MLKDKAWLSLLQKACPVCLFKVNIDGDRINTHFGTTEQVLSVSKLYLSMLCEALLVLVACQIQPGSGSFSTASELKSYLAECSEFPPIFLHRISSPLVDPLLSQS